MMHRTEELEAKLGIEPLHAMLAQRTALVERVADYRARYGSFGTFDHLRKSELARLSALIRAQSARDKIRKTEAQLDEEAHAHPDYLALIAEATRQRAEWVRLEAQIEAIDFRIRRGQSLAGFAASEARL